MKILEIVRDKCGKITGYMLCDNDKTMYQDKETCVKLKDFITNAVCIDADNGIFRIKEQTKASSMLQEVRERVVINRPKVQLDQTIGGAQFVGLCRKLRTAIKAGKVRVDMSKHNANSGYNQQYFKVIEAIGLSVEEFILGYLMNVQPFMLRWHSDNNSVGNIVILDTGYKVDLYIKIKQDNSIIISFHDNNKHGKSKYATKWSRGEYPEYSYILSNMVLDSFGYKYFVISRGLTTFRLGLSCRVVAPDLAIVRTDECITQLREHIMDYVIGVMERENGIRLSDRLKAKLGEDSKLSFLSYGAYSVSTISLIIDLYGISTDMQERRRLVTLLEVIINDEFFADDKPVMLNALQEVYAVKSKNDLYILAERLLGG